MPIQKEYTPLPGTRRAPMRVEVPVWEDVPANSRVELLRHTISSDTTLDLEYVGARPEDDITVEVAHTAQTRQGRRTTTEEVTASALPSFGHPAQGGPLATENARWSVLNSGTTDYTQADANNDPYTAFLNYTITDLTVLDKLRFGIPINEREDSLRNELGLDRYLNMGIMPEKGPFYEPSLEEKPVIEDGTRTETVDINSTGAGNGQSVWDHRVRENEVLYITGVTANSEEFTVEDNLTLSFTRDGTDEFYRLPLAPLPGGAYEADLHIPILSDVSVTAFADNTLTDVDLQIRYARVSRTLMEKALYGLDNEVRSNDNLADQRFRAYERLQDYIDAGVPVMKNLDTVLSEVGADDRVAAPR